MTIKNENEKSFSYRCKSFSIKIAQDCLGIFFFAKEDIKEIEWMKFLNILIKWMLFRAQWCMFEWEINFKDFVIMFAKSVDCKWNI